VDVGIVSNSSGASILKRLEFAAYRKAAAAIVLCEAFRTALRDDGFPVEAVHVIRDSVDLQAIRPGSNGTSFRQRCGIGAREFVVLYSGSLGLKQGLSDVLDAAKLVAPLATDVRWVLVGEGETRSVLASRIQTENLGSRVLLLPLQPEADVSAMLAASDILLLNQRRTVKDTVIPSKLLMYMAAGRPVLAAVNVDSQGASLLREAGGGVVVAPEDPQALATAVIEARTRPEQLEAQGRRNRRYAEQHFEREAILMAQQRVIERVLEGCDRLQTSSLKRASR